MRWKLALYAVCFSVLLAGCGGGPERSNVTQLMRQDGRVGTGAEAVSGRSVTVHYTGWLYDESQPDHKGAKFDSSLDRNEPFSFNLGGGQVIAGWDEGVAGMKVGGATDPDHPLDDGLRRARSGRRDSTERDAALRGRAPGRQVGEPTPTYIPCRSPVCVGLVTPVDDNVARAAANGTYFVKHRGVKRHQGALPRDDRDDLGGRGHIGRLWKNDQLTPR